MSRFNELLNGYLHDSLSESELEEFFALVKGNESLLDEHIIRETRFEEKHTGLTDDKRREKMLSNIRRQARATERELARTEHELTRATEHELTRATEHELGSATEHELGSATEHKPAKARDLEQAGIMEHKIVRLQWWLAAAAVLILLIGGGVFLAVRKERAVPLVKSRQFKNDVAPGTYGAVLQLADGSKITLDSIGNGMVTRQGNTQVMKQAGGGVAYLTSGSNGLTPASNGLVQGNNNPPSGSNSPEVFYNTLSTGKGKQFQVTLPDGTKAWLNSSSSLSYPTSFNGAKQRLVEMTGEAYFEVAPNASKPFVVRTDKEDVTVLGTHFNINSYEDEPALKTSLLEGSVSVSNSSGKVRILPGQQAAVLRNKAGKDRISVGEANVEDAIAWKNGVFNFDNADIRTVMRQLARWYDVEVTYSGPIPAWQDFKGEIGRNLSLAQVLKVLEQARVHFRIEEDKRIVIFQ